MQALMWLFEIRESGGFDENNVQDSPVLLVMLRRILHCVKLFICFDYTPQLFSFVPVL